MRCSKPGWPRAVPRSPFERYAHYSFDEDLPLGNNPSPRVALVLMALLAVPSLAQPLAPLIASVRIEASTSRATSRAACQAAPAPQEQLLRHRPVDNPLTASGPGGLPTASSAARSEAPSSPRSSRAADTNNSDVAAAARRHPLHSASGFLQACSVGVFDGRVYSGHRAVAGLGLASAA